VVEGERVGGINARYPELPFSFLASTRAERSLFYPAVEPIGTNEIYSPIPLYIVAIVIHQLPNHRQVRSSCPLLPSERAALGQSRLSSSGLTPETSISTYCLFVDSFPGLQDLRAALADDNGVCVREDGGDGEATRALHVHEE
jgi:hypothetical protein